MLVTKEREELLLSNWDYFFEIHPFNYKNAIIKGRFYDTINSYEKNNVCCFPVREDAQIKAGDIVMIDFYCEAFPLNMFHEIEDNNCCEIIGSAIECFCTTDNKQQKVVFVKKDVVLSLDNTNITEFRVTEDDICGPCYLQDLHTVCTDDTKAIAGQIMGIENGKILVYINLKWGESDAY